MAEEDRIRFVRSQASLCLVAGILFILAMMVLGNKLSTLLLDWKDSVIVSSLLAAIMALFFVVFPSIMLLAMGPRRLGRSERII